MTDNGSNLLNVLAKGHGEALSEAEKYLPDMKLIDLIDQLCDVMSGKTTIIDAGNALAEKYKTSAKVYIDVLASISIQQIMKDAQDESLRSMDNADFARQVVDTAESIGHIIHQYCNGTIKDTELIQKLVNSGIKDLTKAVLDSCDVDTDKLLSLKEEPFFIANAMFAYYASMEAYKILAKAQKDAAIQHEITSQIQDTCARSIESIKRHRLEMNELVEKYMSDHLETFESGLQAMDDALLAGDADGFIKENVQIQEILHYDIQFTSASEFNVLMDSDQSFKL